MDQLKERNSTENYSFGHEISDWLKYIMHSYNVVNIVGHLCRLHCVLYIDSVQESTSSLR